MALVILPNQLFDYDINVLTNKKIYFIEHDLYFINYNYHKIKLILHRASMQKHYDKYKRKYVCHYVAHNHDYEHIFKSNKNVFMFDPIDHDVLKEFKDLSKKYHTKLTIYDSPNFICKNTELNEYVQKHPLIHKSFYVFFRKKYNILMNNDKPIGGKWSFDTENREKFPDSYNDTFIPKQNNDKYVIDATKYIEKYFGDNIGEIFFYLPIDHTSANKYFNDFIKKRLSCFGKYEDASKNNVNFGCHSVISALLNIGLLDPINVITSVINALSKSNIASVEGFVRQIFWREYVRCVYIYKYDELNLNHFNNERKLNKNWYNATTNIPNIDDCINKFKKYGYLHHIERLMHVGNFMLLTDIKPDDVYKWFMMFIDAYPWVMAPNVYGMSQFSSGNMMMKKPYFSSSNYIKKMSNYKQCDAFIIWDALYYRFINKHLNEFSKIYSTASIANHWKKKSKSDQKKILNIAENYLKKY
jgi:deoxyribodipyrimidine photolyase-related protein